MTAQAYVRDAVPSRYAGLVLAKSAAALARNAACPEAARSVRGLLGAVETGSRAEVDRALADMPTDAR